MAYPDSYPSRRNLANRAGVVYDADKTKVFYAEDHNELIDDLESIMTTLGLNPEGTHTTVADRLDELETELAGTPSKFSVTIDTAQSIPDSASTLIEFDSVYFDAGGDFDSDAHRFIAPENGYYFFNAFARVDIKTADKYAYLAIYKNNQNVGLTFSHSSSTSDITPKVACLLYLEVDDFVDVRIYQNTGLARDILSNYTRTKFDGFRVK